MQPAPTSRVRRCSELVLLAAFASGICGSLVDQCLRPAGERDVVAEYRTPAKLPPRPQSLRALRALPAKFDAWYLDHFGLRDVLLRWHNVAKWFALGVSPTRKLVLGSDGWVFATDWRALEDHRGAMPMSPGALAAWQRMLEGRRDWLAHLGIEYVFAVVPYKSRVYSEHVPENRRNVAPTRCDQLLEHLARHSDFRILDMREAMLAAKRHDAPGDETFFPLGTHWTDRGAHAGYVELARELARRLPTFRPLPDDAFAQSRADVDYDSWAGRLHMQDLLQRPSTSWNVREPEARFSRDFAAAAEFRSERSGDELPSAYIAHDSFELQLRPWLAESFGRMDCAWVLEPDVAKIRADRPDVVIQIYNEQSLLRITPELTREEDGGARQRRFEASTSTLWRFDPATFPEGLKAGGSARLSLDGDVLVDDRGSESDVLRLPELEYPPGADLLLRVDLESPKSSIFHVFYGTRRDPETYRDHHVSSKVEAGRDTLYFDIPDAGFAGRLALWPSLETGIVRIHAIEVRAAFVETESARATARDRDGR